MTIIFSIAWFLLELMLFSSALILALGFSLAGSVVNEVKKTFNDEIENS